MKTFRKIPLEENPSTLEQAILRSLFESVDKSPKRKIKKIDDGIELRPRDKIITKTGEYMIRALKNQSGERVPGAKVLKTFTVYVKHISNDPPSAKFFPYKNKRLVLEEKISPYRLAHELAKEINSFKERQAAHDDIISSENMENVSRSLKGLPIPQRRHRSAIQKIVLDETRLNQERRELYLSLRDFLLASAKKITAKAISDRMICFYVAKILVATGIETGTIDEVDEVFCRLQTKYRYWIKEKEELDSLPSQ